jgi:hypothetical protein
VRLIPASESDHCAQHEKNSDRQYRATLHGHH